MYNTIINPKTGRKVLVNGKLGKSIIRNYIKFLHGGGNFSQMAKFSMYGLNYCGWCKTAKPDFVKLINTIKHNDLSKKVNVEYIDGLSLSSEERGKLNIHSYPTYILTMPGDKNPIHFGTTLEERTEEAMLAFLKKKISTNKKKRKYPLKKKT